MRSGSLKEIVFVIYFLRHFRCVESISPLALFRARYMSVNFAANGPGNEARGLVKASNASFAAMGAALVTIKRMNNTAVPQDGGEDLYDLCEL